MLRYPLPAPDILMQSLIIAIYVCYMFIYVVGYYLVRLADASAQPPAVVRPTIAAAGLLTIIRIYTHFVTGAPI